MLFRFGIITDVQHADKDMVSFEGRPQRYRESLGKLKAALSDLAPLQAEADDPLSFVLTLGDIIDGYSSTEDAVTAAEHASKDLHEVVQEFSSALHIPVHHVLGNHCLAAQRSELLAALHMPGSYYSVNLGHGWKLIVLDTTDMSLYSGYPEDGPQMQQARQWMASHPKEQHPNAEDWNGGLSEAQMAWLQQQLAEATTGGQQVIVACHHPIAPGSAPDSYLAWNYKDIMSLLEDSKTVKLVLSGHYHPGGYVQRNGVHYLVFEGILEAPADSNAYGVVEVWPEKCVIKGHGVARSRQLLLS